MASNRHQTDDEKTVEDYIEEFRDYDHTRLSWIQEQAISRGDKAAFYATKTLLAEGDE